MSVTHELLQSAEASTERFETGGSRSTLPSRRA